MNSIYEDMKTNWKTYCLMSGIAFIEEMSKPSLHKYIKGNKESKSYNVVQLKLKNKETVDTWLKITRIWERVLNTQFITSNFNKPKIHKNTQQFYINFLPNWLYFITKTVSSLPSNYSNKKIFERLKNWKIPGNYKLSRNILTDKEISSLCNSKDSLYKNLFFNKHLAAGAFVVSFDLEFRGTTTGRLDLTMTERYKDFLEFMLNLAKKYNWNTKSGLVKIKMDYNINRGVNASPQFCFRVKTSKLKEIYTYGGYLLDKHKDKCIKFHINRSSKYVNRGYHNNHNAKNEVYDLLKKMGPSKSTELQFYTNTAIDVISDHLRKLEKEGFVNRERKGKYFLWSVNHGY